MSSGGDMNQQQQLQQQQQWMAMQQYQQQWMAMQYPPATMLMYGQHYVPYYLQHQQAAAAAAPQQQYQQQKQSPPRIQSSGEDNRTIWIGDLQQWMDEGYLHSCFAPAGEVISVKIIRNKLTGQSERYGFVEFSTHAAAEKVLQSYSGTMMPNAEQPFRLNWAAFSTGDKRTPEPSSDLSIFVGDLAADVTDTLLHETFANRYSSVKGAKVVVDSNTGRSKGYGFVRFADENERSRAMTEMNGEYCSSRPMRIGVATPKKPSTQHQHSSQAGGFASNGAQTQGSQSDGDSSNTTIFVGGLDSDVTEEELRQSFIQFGDVVSVKIPAGKGCGFVQFASRSAAEDALEKVNGSVIGKQTVRLSWGRTPSNKQHGRNENNGQWNGAYYGRQNYGGYGYYMSQNRDQNMYTAAGYGSHQQPVS
nr:polyadenylate-binding protein RBP47-like [Ipomoea trifida]